MKGGVTCVGAVSELSPHLTRPTAPHPATCANQTRLSTLISSLGCSFEKDRLPYMFARLCGLAEPLPQSCCQVVLRALLVVFDGSPPLPAVTSKWDISVPVHKAVEALRTVAASVTGANATMGVARLCGFALFPVLTVSFGNQRGWCTCELRLVLGFADACDDRGDGSTAAAPKATRFPNLRKSHGFVRARPCTGDQSFISPQPGGPTPRAGAGTGEVQFVDGAGVVGDADLEADVVGALPERLARNVSAMEAYVTDLSAAMARVGRTPVAASLHRRALLGCADPAPEEGTPTRGAAGTAVVGQDTEAIAAFVCALAYVLKRKSAAAAPETPHGSVSSHKLLRSHSLGGDLLPSRAAM
jgi:hypothetical protein